MGVTRARASVSRKSRRPTTTATRGVVRARSDAQAGAKVRLELRRLRINKNVKVNWHLYLVLATEDPKNPAKTVVSVIPEKEIALTKRSNNRYSFKPKGKNTEGFTIFEARMPKDRHLKVNAWVFKSKKRSRKTGAGLAKVTGFLDKNVASRLGPAAAANPYVAAAIVVNKGLNVVGKMINNAVDRNLGMVPMNEEFEPGGGSTGVRKAGSSTGLVTLRWSWDVDEQATKETRTRRRPTGTETVTRSPRARTARSLRETPGRRLADVVRDRVSPVFRSALRSSGATVVMRGGRRVPHLFQGDPLWAAVTLNDDDTISSAGCAITSVAMMLRYYGRDVTPLSIDRHLDENDGYLPNSDSVRWQVALDCADGDGPSLRYAERIEDPQRMTQAIESCLDAQQPVLARVDYLDDADSKYNHFIVIVGRTADGEWIFNDPGTATGDGAARPTDSACILQQTERRGGYELVAVDRIDVME